MQQNAQGEAENPTIEYLISIVRLLDWCRPEFVSRLPGELMPPSMMMIRTGTSYVEETRRIKRE